MASYSTQDGFGLGLLGIRPSFLTEGGVFRFNLEGTVNGKSKLTAGVLYPRSRRSFIQVGTGYRNDLNARYFGTGPESTQERESFYREETSWVGVNYARFQSGMKFRWEVSFLFSGVGAIGSDESRDPHTSAEFENELPPGYGDRSDGRSAFLELQYDDTGTDGRTEEGRPSRGGIRRIKLAAFQSTGNNDADFTTYRVELQQFVPLWHTKRVLALRAYLSSINLLEGSEVPFQRMMTNDGSDRFRGYTDERFRDRGITGYTAEFRWPVWSSRTVNGFGVDGFVFADWGQVFRHVEHISTDLLRHSVGGGIRIAGNGKFYGLFEVGRSEEEWTFRFGAEQIFQWARGGLFRGSTPVPER